MTDIQVLRPSIENPTRTYRPPTYLPRDYDDTRDESRTKRRVPEHISYLNIQPPETTPMITNDNPLPIYGFIIWGVLVFIILANSILGQCLAGWSSPKMGVSTARRRIAGTMAGGREMGITEKEKVSEIVELRKDDAEFDKNIDWDKDGSHYSQDESECGVLGIRGHGWRGDGGGNGNRGIGNGSGVERKPTTTLRRV